jgi:MFS family permease
MSDNNPSGPITDQPWPSRKITEEPSKPGPSEPPIQGGLPVPQAPQLKPSRSDMILFWASFLTLIAAGIGFSVRGAILADWSKQFGFTQGELGSITGGGLVGFGLTIIALSFVADRVGYGVLMVLAFLLHVSSAVVTLCATFAFEQYGKEAAYWCLYVGMFLFSLGNGTCEAVINPLTATLFPRNKTHWLNILHAGWPGGLILGALLGLGFAALHVRWEIQIATFLVPTLAYGLMMLGRRFPHSEARAHGVPMRDMVGELGMMGAAVILVLLALWGTNLLAGSSLPHWTATAVAGVVLLLFGGLTGFRPGHWMLAFLLVLHALVGYVELGTDSWIANITGTILENKQYGLMLFIWTSGLMFVLRFFAGPIVHQISPLGLLFVSGVLGCVGLLLLGHSQTALLCVIAATVYGFGKTFLWPTMLGVVSERFPRGGAITLGAIGGVGMLSAGILGGPGIGYKQDYFASKKLEELSPETYARYKSDSKVEFLFFPPVSGLDGSKVAALRDDAEKLKADVDVLEKTHRKLTPEQDEKLLAEAKKGKQLTADETVNVLWFWWLTEARPNLKTDKEPVEKATLYGGQMALTYTAAIPATMALGYLILIFYFRLRGGYQAEVLVGHAAHDEEFTGGVEGPAEM